MIRCRLAALLERKGLKVAEVARRTGLNRSTITALYKNSAARVELPVMDRLCRYFGCSVGDLFEYVRDGSASQGGGLLNNGSRGAEGGTET